MLNHDKQLTSSFIDTILSAPMANDNFTLPLGKTYDDELHCVIIHGILHHHRVASMRLPSLCIKKQP